VGSERLFWNYERLRSLAILESLFQSLNFYDLGYFPFREVIFEPPGEFALAQFF